MSDRRNMFFVKNSNKNVPAPSEDFLTSVKCAVTGLLREFEENRTFSVPAARRRNPTNEHTQNK